MSELDPLSAVENPDPLYSISLMSGILVEDIVLLLKIDYIELI